MAQSSLPLPRSALTLRHTHPLTLLTPPPLPTLPAVFSRPKLLLPLSTLSSLPHYRHEDQAMTKPALAPLWIPLSSPSTSPSLNNSQLERPCAPLPLSPPETPSTRSKTTDAFLPASASTTFSTSTPILQSNGIPSPTLTSPCSPYSPVSPRDRAQHLLLTISTVLHGYGSRRTCPPAHVQALNDFFIRAHELYTRRQWTATTDSESGSKVGDGVEVEEEKGNGEGNNIHNVKSIFADKSAEEIQEANGGGDGSGSDRGGGETKSQAHIQANNNLTQLEEEWWESQVAAIWFGPSPRRLHAVYQHDNHHLRNHPQVHHLSNQHEHLQSRDQYRPHDQHELQTHQRQMNVVNNKMSTRKGNKYNRAPILHRDTSYVGLNDE